jgi:signal transduction histidine kinase
MHHLAKKAGASMPTPESAKGRFQVDWMISNLRWLLLVSVTLVSLTDIFINQGGDLDMAYLLPQIILLVIAALYNVGVTLLLSYNALRRAMPVMTLSIDTVLTIGFVITSGGLTSPLLFFALFPIITAALRFHWIISLLVALVIIASCGFVGYTTTLPKTGWLDMLPFAASALILLMATLVTGLVGDRVKRTIAHKRRREEEAESQKLRAAQEHSRAIFELASTLSATMNYNKVLETILEVGEAGIQEFDQPGPTQASLVTLFGKDNLYIAASRHLPHRDQNTTFEGRSGVLGQVLKTAETIVIDNPATDPELCQLITMHSCKQAIVVPLRAGFENFGVVVFGSDQPNAYTEDQKALLTAVCNQAIVALQNSQLYQNLMEEKERIVQVEEDERKKLARDLHDGPTQSIAAIAMRINYTRMVLDRAQDIKQASDELEKIEELARRTTKEIRHMLFTLRPLILESQGLRAALEQYIKKLAETDSTSYHLEAESEIDQLLEQNTQGVIFYIIEEAIGNARKHAKANNLWIRLYTKDKTFVAEVEDDGAGFDVEAVQVRYDERGSLGMINMHERAELVSGRLSIASAPGKGTRITLVAPLPRR